MATLHLFTKFAESFARFGFVTFVVIVQSADIVELLKDFTALFVISTIDDMFFSWRITII